MRVIKRTGGTEEVSFDKVLNRLRNLSDNLNVDIFDVTQKVCSRIYDNVLTSELDELAAHICSSMIIDNPDYGTLASRIIISNHHKNTSPSFSETITILYENKDIDNNSSSLIDERLYDTVMKNKEKLNSIIDYNRDYSFDYFGFKTLEKSYLMRINGRIVERPQQMLMRVSLGIHRTDFKDALETYEYMSKKYFTHATPTLFNSGTPRPQLSSCFLLSMCEDSISGIYQSLQECAMISKYAGGIGIHIHNVRSKNSRIRGTNGTSSGIIPMLRVFNNTARYVDQAGRRAGSIAVYLEPWHADIMDFLDLKKPHGHEEDRARDLFYALWIPDLFMERVKENGMWSLMCPDKCKGLADVWGDKFKKLYESYEEKKMYFKQVKAQDLWFKILESQIETGTPYILYKDAANAKSNQQNLGTIKSSNLCSEIIEYSSPDEIAVCNLASICLPTYVETDSEGKPFFNFEKLHDIVKIATKNLNKIIDVNFYPLEKARVSNLKHRPIGIGIQGLADTFILMRLPFESVEASELNKLIAETMYHAAAERSMEISKTRCNYIKESINHIGHSSEDINAYLNLNEFEPSFTSTYPGAYSTFEGCPASKGLLQFDLWNVTPTPDRYDWDGLKEDIKKYGMRNSLLIAPMPTASTSQIMGFNEAMEPMTSNIYKRKTSAGEFILVNKYLINDLTKLDLWNKDMKNKIIINEGSIQNINEIPQHLRDLYKIVWEMKQKSLIDLAADRGAYVCQSQSMNLFVEEPDFKKLSSMHFYTWQKGLKTGIYYLRTKSKSKPQQFTMEPVKPTNNISKKVVCTDEICLVCSS
jgi:ribonucleoside-diphosphate reductase alpha chain